MSLVLVSHPLCPYVQRIAIALDERGTPYERRTIDLAAKPDWFLALSPLGKTPVLVADGTAIFESAVILEYLDEVLPRPLLPAAPLDRARHRAWIEFGSAVLNDIAGLYNAPDAAAFAAKASTLAGKFARLEGELSEPWFDRRFGLVDAVFGPVFRYFDSLDRIGDFGILTTPKVLRWRAALAARPSVAGAVAPDYPDRLMRFFEARGSHLSRLALAAQAA